MIHYLRVQAPMVRRMFRRRPARCGSWSAPRAGLTCSNAHQQTWKSWRCCVTNAPNCQRPRPDSSRAAADVAEQLTAPFLLGRDVLEHERCGVFGELPEPDIRLKSPHLRVTQGGCRGLSACLPVRPGPASGGSPGRPIRRSTARSCGDRNCPCREPVGEPVPGQSVKIVDARAARTGFREILAAVGRSDAAEVDHVGDGHVVFRLEPAFPDERVAGLGHVGRPCHVSARGRYRDHRPEQQVLHRDGASPAEADQHREAAVGEVQVGAALGHVAAPHKITSRCCTSG
jgi:hypothetical protein